MNKQAKHMHKRISGLAGFSIMEVMIGIFIFVVGLLALSALQGALTRSMADAKVRTTAVNIAERTIERQRGFTQLLSDTVTSPPAWLAYNDIVGSTGTEVVNGITYTVTTNVTDQYYDVASDGFTETAPSGVANSTYKEVQVTVSWNAAQNFRGTEGTEITAADIGSGEIMLAASIPALVTSASAQVADESTGGTAAPPITYQPGANPDIISLSLGDNKFKESLLPEPDVTNIEELVETTFDVITYSQTDAGSYFLRREEFASVACECALKAPSADYPARRPVIWAGDEYVRGQQAVKAYGVSANNQQSWMCDTCCRDHHDGGASADAGVPDHGDTAVNVVHPFRPSSEYITSGTFRGDHKHYDRAKKTGALVQATSDGDTYVESCRMVRVDGFFRVAQDFRREDLNIFPADFMDDVNEIDVYSDFVTGAAATFANYTFPDYETNPPCIGPAPCSVEPAPMQGDYNDPIEVDGEGNPIQFPSWTTLPYWDVLTPMNTQQLRSRGLYIDYLSYDLRTVLANCTGDKTPDDSECQSGDVILDRTGSVNPLEMIPFFDVQMTKLNRWNETPVPNVPVDTTNQPLANNSTHSRGVISKTDDGQSTVVAGGHRGNTGFTDTLPTDPSYYDQITEASLFVYADDTTIEPPDPPDPPDPGDVITISGIWSETLPGDPSLVITGANGVECAQVPYGYTCLVPTDAVNPQIMLSGYGKKNADRWACSVDTVLTKANEVINGENAKADFLLTGVVAGSTYNFVLEGEACGA